jgi:hypothetical protein
MKQTIYLLVLLSLTSCKYFETKKIDSSDLLYEELKTFNWNEIDSYPTFSVCDSKTTKSEKKQCFETTLTSYVSNALQQETITVTQDITDTVILEIQISETGELQINNIQIDSITRIEIPRLEKVLMKSLDSLPKVFPAIKRNQPVKTAFKLPIIIAVN